MKKSTSLWILFLFVLAGIGMQGCGQAEKPGALLTVDVKADYPEKEMTLQDIMDVEYIPLETTDEFITQGSVMAVGDKFILVKNYANDGDIFVFDRKTGKGLRKINRKGQGAEEYAYIVSIVLDEENEEMFVNSSQTILVYDLAGNFKRSFHPAGGANYMDLFNFDKDNLICYDVTVYYEDGKEREKEFYHAILSKQDGHVVQGLPIPFKTVSSPFVHQGDGVAAASVRALVPCRENWFLVETSSDTVYCYTPETKRISPFLVKQSSGEPEVLVTMGPVTDRYCFLQTIKKEFDFTKGRGFPSTCLVYDKQENAIFRPVVVNADITCKQVINLTANVGNGKVATHQNLMAHQLVEAYKNNQLKGRLKEIAATLDEDSNPVVMLMKYKNVQPL